VVSDYATRLAGGESARSASAFEAPDLEGVWIAPDGGQAVFRVQSGAGGDPTYAVEVQPAGAPSYQLEGTFDGSTLELRPAEGDRFRLERVHDGAAGVLARLGEESVQAEPTTSAERARPAGSYAFDPDLERLVAASPVDGAVTPYAELQRPVDDVLHFGLNANADYEVAALRRTGATVVAIGPGGAAADPRAFAAGLGLPAAQADAVALVLQSADSRVRDELQQLVQAWAAAERGEAIPSRMVISGHHVSDAVWGDHNGRLPWSTLRALAEAMPRAAAQVEDLHVSACYSGGARAPGRFAGIFPQLRTLWAYTRSAPGAASGATAHQRYWERGTRGRDTEVVAQRDRLLELGTRKAESIDVHVIGASSRASGPSFEELSRAVRAQEALFRAHFDGLREATDPGSGPLRAYYDLVQQALQHPDAPSDWLLAQRRDATIRLLYYRSHVAPAFARAYRAQLEAGFAELGEPLPDLGSLSRFDAAQLYERVAAEAGDTPAERELVRLLRGLYELSPGVIPEHWV
jgi:hypothetical protein